MHAVEQKPYKGSGMEGRIARWYARTRRSDMEDFRQQAKAVARHLARGFRVLEVAPGPGFFAIELAKLGDFKITGLDISRTLVDIAKENAGDAGVQVDFRLGNASAMPFVDGSFDFVYCSAAFKNFAEPVKALDEMYRVLRPGGEAIVVDLRSDVSPDEIDAYVRQSKRSRVDAWMTTLAFRCMLVKRAYSRDEFLRMAQKSRFGACQIKVASIGFEVRLAKEPLAAVSVS
jgi:ubiquinone/menaquinone biosynthesis C-methylase UbiE